MQKWIWCPYLRLPVLPIMRGSWQESHSCPMYVYIQLFSRLSVKPMQTIPCVYIQHKIVSLITSAPGDGSTSSLWCMHTKSMFTQLITKEDLTEALLKPQWLPSFKIDLNTTTQWKRFMALLFCDVMWHRLVVGCQHCGAAYRCQIQGLDRLNLEDGTHRLPQTISNQLPTNAVQHPITQASNYTAAEM